jgi:class 3 adenylate cyclase
VSGENYLLIVACILGALLGFNLSTKYFVLALPLAAVALVGGGLYGFAYHNLVIPWFYPSMGLLLSGLGVFSERALMREKTNQTLRAALQGVVSDDRLAEIIDHPERLVLEPSARVVTIMFIDIVGFSVLSETQAPKDAFKHLKQILNILTETVHEFGGVVDKTLGDGILAFFGYNYDGKEAHKNHADMAIRCAFNIQKRAIARDLDASEHLRPLYPLRIGINTAEVYIGDLGDSRSIDFTLIGHGVNFAQRLESACDPYSILIGATTRDMAAIFGELRLVPNKRYIQIKHHETLLEAWECDPFINNPAVRRTAEQAFRDYAGIKRADARWPMPQEIDVRINTQLGTGRLVNFSVSGLAVEMPAYLAKGINISLGFDHDDPEFIDMLNEAGVKRVIAEVRWGRPLTNNTYLHGFLIKNLDANQKDAIVEAFRLLLRKNQTITAA